MAKQKATVAGLPDRSGLPGLPVRQVAEALRAALAEGHAVLSAEPGSGKTTLVPLLLLDASWLAGQRIVMLEPRRPAARMAARRMAALLDEPVGATVGYQVRFERRLSAASRIEVLTEGLLLRRLQSDPELKGVGLLIFDEFHERNLVSDLSLALALDVAQGLRPDLRLLVMSASLDAQPLAALLPARVVTAAGRQHPVAIVHGDRDADLRDPLAACMPLLARALAEAGGDVLVFLPGRREIDAMRLAVAQRWEDDLEVLTLYGEMSADDQDRVLRGRAVAGAAADGRRRVILATDIAETSLTIEGIGVVVDAGLVRRPVFDPNTGLTHLQTQRISQASALQRAGRAGRLGPGTCYRAWTTARHARLDEFSTPEILQADLAMPVLELAHWGVTDRLALHWLDPPPAAHWEQAVALLRQLGALDAQGQSTHNGRRMAGLPLAPRLAHMFSLAAGEAGRRLAADVAALLAERDPLRRAGTAVGADIEVRLDALQGLRADRSLPAGADRGLLRRIDRAAQQLLRHRHAVPDETGAADDATALAAADCLALAYPDRVAVCASADGRRYRMRNGRAALLGEADPLRGSDCLAIGSVDAGRRDGVIWLAARFDRAQLEARFAADIEVAREVRWDDGVGDVVAREVRRLGALLLQERPTALAPGDPVADLLIDEVRRRGLDALFDDPSTLRARVMLARGLAPEDWPDFSPEALLEDLETWLAPWLHDGEGAAQLRRLSLEAVLTAHLGWQRQQQLDAWFPLHLQTPAGTRRAIRYAPGEPPVLAVPLQEMLGLGAGPVLAEGRQPLLLHLLSPAGRPLQVTTDLAAFWAGAYSEVRKEMRGRYPKHFWPEDPASATPTRHTKRRM